jgi:hypothetical protein
MIERLEFAWLKTSEKLCHPGIEFYYNYDSLGYENFGITG